jgi:hypothetical protein
MAALELAGQLVVPDGGSFDIMDATVAVDLTLSAKGLFLEYLHVAK